VGSAALLRRQLAPPLAVGLAHRSHAATLATCANATSTNVGVISTAKHRTDADVGEPCASNNVSSTYRIDGPHHRPSGLLNNGYEPTGGKLAITTQRDTG